MADVVIPLGSLLTYGDCYYFTGLAANRQIGESALIEIGNGTTFDTLGTVSANGGFVFFFTYDTGEDYTEINITFTGGEFDLTQLKLRLRSECDEKICSECFRLQDCTPPHREHLKLEWTNNDGDNSEAFGFNYAVPFTQSLYIVGGLRNANYSYDEEIFQTSIQERFPIYVAATKVKELWVHELPEYLHDALRLALVHDIFKIDGERFVKLEGEYAPDWDTPNSMLAPVIVNVTKFDQNTVNDNCS